MATLPFLTSFNILMNISRNFLNFCVISDQMHVAIVFAFCDLKIIIYYVYPYMISTQP